MRQPAHAYLQLSKIGDEAGILKKNLKNPIGTFNETTSKQKFK